MKITKKTVIVCEQELLISIGVHAHEKLAPQRLIVSVQVELDGAVAEDDKLDSTLDYDRIHDFVKGQEQSEHAELQETIARRILEFVLSGDKVLRAIVETRKPDVFDDCAYVGVRLEGES